MKRRLATAYAIFCTLLLIAGFLLVFFFAWQAGVGATVSAIVGLAIGFIFAPIVHELGHIAFANSVQFSCVYAKFFCFKITRIKGRKKFYFASPFAADQTQVIPKTSGRMDGRAAIYTAGGLIFSGIFLVVILATALAFTFAWKTNYVAWGTLPYAAYLFLLNVMPLEYAGGKTDALVYKGIKKGYDAEKCMLSAMEIHGNLFEGKRFSEIEEGYYFNLPQLSEEEPLFALLLDLRYRYFLDRGEVERAEECLNRLVASQEYLSDGELEKIAAELVYMHSINGDLRAAEESGKVCRDFLRGESATAKRALAAYSIASGKTEAIEPLLEQAREALRYEWISGEKKLEEELLSRLKPE